MQGCKPAVSAKGDYDGNQKIGTLSSREKGVVGVVCFNFDSLLCYISLSGNLLIKILMNRAEQFVFQVCKRSFLSLWSYANPLGKNFKELCDILVVCEPDIIIISVKEVRVKKSDDIRTDKASDEKKIEILKLSTLKINLSSKRVEKDKKTKLVRNVEIVYN